MRFRIAAAAGVAGALALGVSGIAALSVGLKDASRPKWLIVRTDGVSVRYPPSWHATVRPLTPVTYPPQIVAVASYPLPEDARGADGCSPQEALDRLPPTGAFIFAWEYRLPSPFGGVRSHDFPPRPKRFKLTSFANYECLGSSYMVRFRQAGRYFQIHVAFGRKAGPAIRTTTLRVLDSLTVRRV